MNKLYDRQTWHNNTTPALNETNLNILSKAVDDIDDRVVEIAGTVMETVPQIQEDLAEAQELIEDAEELTTHPPIIGQNGHWWTWDTSIDDYADSGVDAGVSLTIGTTSTLTPGSDATVENVGTDTDPILNFGIPKGAKGDTGSTGATPNITATATVDAVTGTPSVNVTQSGTAENPSISFAFHNLKGAKGDTGATGQTGPAGQGVPTGGTTGQVLKKKSGTNYDTEWADESGGGSGGHTIINSAGTSMTQRTGLQFSGLNVTDDSTNDKTVVTLPTPDYVDEQFNPSTTYSKGMTCIEGNVRYRYKNSTATSGHRPPDTTYWEVLSVAEEMVSLNNLLVQIMGIVIPPFSTVDDAMLSAILTNYYSGYISLNLIKAYWHIGDTRTVSLSAMSATGVSESHRAQDVEMVIIDFDHDTLATPINGKTRALLTLNQKNCLRDAYSTDTNGSTNTEHGYMNSSNNNSGGWRNSPRRTWCNNVYYNALPASIKELVKECTHETSAGNQSTTLYTDTDKAFLLSEKEVFGNTNKSVAEGSIYPYFNTSGNRYKMPGWNTTYPLSDMYWFRSPSKNSSAEFCSLGVTGAQEVNNASRAIGIAPAICL